MWNVCISEKFTRSSFYNIHKLKTLGNMKLQYLLILGFLWSQTTLSGQAEEDLDRNIAQIGANLYVGLPQGDFNDNLNGVGIGGGGSIFIRIGNQPIYFGGEFGIMGYERLTQYATVNIAGFFREYELQTRSSILTAHVGFRVRPQLNSPVIPYIDGLIGLKSLFTRTNLNDLELPDEDNPIESRKEQGGLAFSYGGALGLQLDIFSTSDIIIDLKCSYLPGANASYLVLRDDIDGQVFDDPIDAYNEKASPTDLIIPQIGITINLSKGTFASDYDDY